MWVANTGGSGLYKFQQGKLFPWQQLLNAEQHLWVKTNKCCKSSSMRWGGRL